MTKIEPQLLTETFDKKALEDASNNGWYAQIKENGTRNLIHVIDGKIAAIRNRANNPVLYCYPELKEVVLPFKSAILDGEIIVEKNGKSVFYGGVDSRRSTPSKQTLEEKPVKLIVFDILKSDEGPMIMKPYKERYSKLLSIQESKFISVAKNYNPMGLWERVVKEDLEGVVLKNPNAMYEMGARSKNQIKIKNYKFCEVLVEKVEPNDKGVKVFGTTDLNGTRKEVPLSVEVQLGGIFDVPIGSVVPIKYLDITSTIPNRLIQATKVSKEQVPNDTL